MWVNPSPNLRSFAQAIVYPGIGLIESSNLSVGRGTEGPWPCEGVEIVVSDRKAVDAPELGVEVASAVWKLFPEFSERQDRSASAEQARLRSRSSPVQIHELLPLDGKRSLRCSKVNGRSTCSTKARQMPCQRTGDTNSMRPACSRSIG
jgi:uncharacterized protein YbbC (DUF1343 family)